MLEAGSKARPCLAHERTASSRVDRRRFGLGRVHAFRTFQCLVLFAGSCAIAGCGSGAPRRAAGHCWPVEAGSALLTTSPVASAAASVSAAIPCAFAEPPATEPLRFDWEVEVVHGGFGWITTLAANPGGVLVAGAESDVRARAEAIVASFDRDGRQRYRVKLGQPQSSLSPARSVATAIAAARAGEAYVLSTAARASGSAAVALSLLDPQGRVLFTDPLELSAQSSPSLVVDADGAVIVAGTPPGGGGFVLLKLAHDGARLWTQAYPYVSLFEPRLVKLGEGFAVVASLHGAAQFGAQELTRRETISYRCSGQATTCQEGASSLLVAELDARGAPLRQRLLGPSGSRLLVSDVAVTADRRILVTGEYAGPAIALDNVSLCELEPGMPEREENRFRESGYDRHVCDCRGDRRDLFLLELGADAEPRWARTLAVGGRAPRVSVNASGEVRWAAELARPLQSTQSWENAFELWALDANRTLGGRRSAPVLLRQMAAGEGALYMTDQHMLRKTSW